ncbi:hypothetical protein AAG906_007814 [Vitis piasezkii]
MAAANALITMEEVPMFPSLGISPQFITFTHVTMEYDKYLCVWETVPQNSMPVAVSDIYFLILRVMSSSIAYIATMSGKHGGCFRMHITQTKELGTCPVQQIGGCFFFYMRFSNAYIVTVVSSNANITCTFKFDVEAMLGSLWQCLRSWFLGF